MNPKRILLPLAVSLILVCPHVAFSDVNLGVALTDDGLKGFYLAIGDYYDVPQEQVVKVKTEELSAEELAVVFFLSQRASVAPDVIMKLRLGGKSWMEISLQYGISAEAYYVPVEKAPGPPYGKAYGHYKNRKKTKWSEIRLSDSEIINFVNLKFVSGYYDLAPEAVMKSRGEGQSFMGISAEIEKNRTVSKAPSGKDKSDEKAKSSGKSKGKGKS